MPTLNATTMAGIQVTLRKTALRSNTRSELDGSAEVEDSSRTKVEVPKQEEETPKEANLEKATMPKEEVPIAKVGSSSTTEKSKERSCEPNTKAEEKKVLQELAQGLERMSVKQNEFVTTLKEEHHSRTLKRRRTLESDEA